MMANEYREKYQWLIHEASLLFAGKDMKTTLTGTIEAAFSGVPTIIQDMFSDQQPSKPLHGILASVSQMARPVMTPTASLWALARTSQLLEAFGASIYANME